MTRTRLRAAPADDPRTDDTRGPAVSLWVLTEMGAMAGSLGFLVSGLTVPAAVAALGFIGLLWSAPGRLVAP